MRVTNIYHTALIVIALCLASCQDDEEVLLGSTDAKANALKGKIKAMVETNEKGEVLRTNWQYDDTQKHTGYQQQNANTGAILSTQTLVTDAEGRVLSIKTTKADKTSTEQKFEYNQSGRLKATTETQTNGDVITEKYNYDTQGNLSEYTKWLQKGSSTTAQRYLSFKWKNGNIETVIETGLGGKYEEEDFVYNTTKENPATVFFRSLQTQPRLLPEEMTKNTPTESVKLFKGDRMKYEYETTTEGKLSKYKITYSTESNPNQWLNKTELKVEYY